MTPFESRILECIGSTEPSSFNEFCTAMRKKDLLPEKGDKSAWSELFKCLEFLEEDKFVEIERTKGSIESLQLTEDGANIIRDKMDSKRGLLR